MEKKEHTVKWYKKEIKNQNKYKFVSKIADKWAECGFYQSKTDGKYRIWVKYNGNFLKHKMLKDAYGDNVNDPLLEQLLKDHSNVVIQDELNKI